MDEVVEIGSLLLNRLLSCDGTRTNHLDGPRKRVEGRGLARVTITVLYDYRTRHGPYTSHRWIYPVGQQRLACVGGKYLTPHLSLS